MRCCTQYNWFVVLGCCSSHTYTHVLSFFLSLSFSLSHTKTYSLTHLHTTNARKYTRTIKQTQTNTNKHTRTHICYSQRPSEFRIVTQAIPTVLFCFNEKIPLAWYTYIPNSGCISVENVNNLATHISHFGVGVNALRAMHIEIFCRNSFRRSLLFVSVVGLFCISLLTYLSYLGIQAQNHCTPCTCHVHGFCRGSLV